MTRPWRYRAATAGGQVVEGVVDAPTQRGALEALRRQQLVPIDVAPGTVSPLQARRGGRRVGRAPALATFTRTVATMLEAGVTLDRAIAFAAGQARHAELAEAARAVHADLQAGTGLAAALAERPRVFGPVYVAMVAAGEESGSLDASLARLADHLDESVRLQSEVRAALVYPSLMAMATGIGVTLLLLFVVPRFTAMILDEGGTLPLSTRVLLAASAVVVHGWWLLLLVAGGALLAARSWLAHRDHVQRWHAWRLRWPVAGELEEKYATARFTRALGMLLQGGRPVLAALRTARTTVTNAAVAAGLETATEAVSHGERVHVALAGVLPPLASELLAAGEESGRLEEMCGRIADAYESEVRRSLRTLVGVIEPAMILLFGLLVGFVALAMLQAVYGIRLNSF